MNTILVVDDMPIFRDPIAASLRLAGYHTVCAANGRDALAAIRTHRPDVVLLDIAMPVMDGIACLRVLRADPDLGKTPVILLTAMSDKRYVIEAGKLGVHDYLLKSAFSMQELLKRVGKYVAPPPKGEGKTAGAKVQAPVDSAKRQAADVPAAPPSPAPAPIVIPSPVASPAPARVDAPATQLLTRDQCLARAEKALGAKTLSGAVAEVIRLAASPRSNVNDLAPLIARDPLLSARVLQAANSAAYVSSRGVVSTIPDAVRQVGTATVRNIAAAMGIFDAMPPSQPDGFNPIRCWQHSFAVAMLCERLATCAKDKGKEKDVAAHGQASPGIAYLVGLCHDLGDILFHTHFSTEYAQVVEAQTMLGKEHDEVERKMLGMTRGELVQTIVRCLGLPDAIKEPIGAFHGITADAGAPGSSTLLKVLKAAELYANGLLLASTTKSLVAPLTKGECRAAFGAEDPPVPDAAVFRSEVLYTTGVLARLSSAEAESVMKPPFERTTARLWVAREASLSAFDPVTAALESLAHVTVAPRLPEAPDARELNGVVILAPSDLTAGFTAQDVSRALAAMSRPLPVLWLVARANMSAPPPAAKGQRPPPAPGRWPISIEKAAAFVDSCLSETTATRTSAAAA